MLKAEKPNNKPHKAINLLEKPCSSSLYFAICNEFFIATVLTNTTNKKNVIIREFAETDKNGKVMIAALASDLNKPAPPAKKISTKPRLRPSGLGKKSNGESRYKPGAIKTSAITGAGRGDGKAEVKKRKVDPESPSNKAKVKKTLAVNPKNKANAKKRSAANKMKNKAQENALSRYTFKQYENMSVAQRRRLGLPPKLSIVQYAKKALQSVSDFKGTNKRKKKGPSGK